MNSRLFPRPNLALGARVKIRCIRAKTLTYGGFGDTIEATEEWSA